MTNHNTIKFNSLKYAIYNYLDVEIYPGISSIIDDLMDCGRLPEINTQEKRKVYEKQVRKLLKELVKEGYAQVAPIFNEDDGKFYGRGYFKIERKSEV